MRTAAILALALVIVGCSDPAEPDPEIAELVGTWVPEIVSLGAVPSLTFTADREFVSRASGVEVRGRYDVGDGVLSFEDAAPPGMYAGGPFTVEGNVLTLDYVGWGIADEPTPKTATLVRVPALPVWR